MSLIIILCQKNLSSKYKIGLDMRNLLITLTIIFLIVILCTSGFCEVFVSGDNVRIRENEYIDHDLYVGCGDLEVEGVINGDLIAGCRDLTLTGNLDENLYFACRTADIDGKVEGDIIGFAEDIILDGTIMSGFRGGCSSLKILGKVTGDILAGARRVYIGKDAVIDGNLYTGAGELIIDGEITGNVSAKTEKFELAGTVHKNIDITAEKIKFSESASVGGDFTYSNYKEIDEDFASHVAGSVLFKQKIEDEKKSCAGGWFWKIFWLIAALITGFILAALLKTRLHENFKSFSSNPGKYILIGFIGFVAIPAAVIISMVLVFTIPLALIVGVLYFAILYLGWVIGAIYTGKLFFMLLKQKGTSIFFETAVGIVIVCNLGFIPMLGFLFTIVCLFVGLGIFLPLIYKAFSA